MSVYTMGGPHSGSEKQIKQYVSELTPKLEKITAKITKTINAALASPQRSATYWKAVSKDLDLYYDQLYKAYEKWAASTFPAVYKDSLNAVDKQVRKMANVSATASKTARELSDGLYAKRVTEALYRDALESWSSSLLAGRTNLSRITRMTQQALIEEWMIDRAVAEAIEAGNVRYFSSRLAQKSPQYAKLIEAVENERFIQAGSRKFSLEYYAEMVSRVKFHEAQAYAAIQTAGNYGTDLMVVSSHNTKTEICQQYEGKIFSISGKDKRFPLLTDRPPYHVNCLHLLFPQFESALEASGTLDGFAAFSNNKIDRPPQPSNFVPVGSREE